MAEDLAYKLKNSIPNKLIRDDGTITDITGKAVSESVKEYDDKPALPNKFMNPDGTYSTLNEIIASMVDTEIFVPVTELPEIGKDNKIYLVPSMEHSGMFDEYFYNENGQWDKVGEMKIDLSGYPTTEQVQSMINESVGEVLGGEY